MNEQKTKILKENIEIEYKLDYLEIEPNIFIYEIEIKYPKNSKIIAPKLELNEFHTGIAYWAEIDEYIKTKNINALPQKIYSFLDYNDEDKIKAEQEFASKHFEESFKFERVWVEQEESEDSYYESIPVKIRIKDLLNSDNTINREKLARLRIANEREKPFIYNSRLELVPGAVKFDKNNHYYLTDKKYNLELLTEHLRTIDNVEILQEKHGLESLFTNRDGPESIIDIVYFMTLKETQIFKNIYTYLNSNSANREKNYNPYQETMNVFFYLDYLKIMDKKQLYVLDKSEPKNWRYDSDYRHHKEIMPLKEQAGISLELSERNEQNREMGRFKL